MASSWSGVADAYARSFARLCVGTVEPILSALEERTAPSKRLLDVGTGTGTVAGAAAKLGFQVEGVDPEKDMLDYARHAHPQIAFVPGELPNLPYAGGTFAAATANFVINHTADPRASVREVIRVLAPGAPAVITIWPSSMSSMNVLWNDVIEQSEAVRPDGLRLPPEKDFERSVDGLQVLMAECGFVSVIAHEVSWSFDITPADLWQSVVAGIAVLGTTYKAQERDTQLRMEDTFIRLTSQLETKGELHLPSKAILSVGQRPA